MHRAILPTLFATMLFSTVASADNLSTTTADNYHPADASTTTHPMRYGFGMDLGLPSGLAVGFVVHPKVDWLTLQASFTETYLAPGGRLSVKLDPMALMRKLPVGLLLDLQGGFAAREGFPGHADLPSVGYDYLNVYAGLRLGKPNSFHWLFEVGPTYMHANTDRFGSLLGSGSSLSIGNPTVNGWIAPTFSTGFEVVWP